MATAIFFNGRRLNIPQAVSKIDASALASVSPAAAGIVAYLGTAEGGAPLTVDESLADATRPGTVSTRYRSGNLRTAGLFGFEPTADQAIPGGAQTEILVKVNPSTQSGVSLADGNALDALDVTSRDWGLFTNQISIEVAAGTTVGKKYTVVFEDQVEVFDDVGGVSVMDLTYVPGASGYGTALATVSAASLTVAATKAVTGLSAQRTTAMPAPGVVQVASSNAGDTTQTLTVYGLTAGNAYVSEVLTLNGTTVVVGAVAFGKVLAARLSAVAVGTVTASDNPVTVSLFVLTPGQLTRGLLDTTNTPAAGVATVSVDVNSATHFVALGTNAAGTAVSQVINLAAAAVPVVGTTQFGALTTLLLGDVPGARTVTVAINAVVTLHTEFSTVQRAVDRLNALAGFTANSNVSNPTTFLMVDLDYHQAAARPAVSVLSVVADLYADLMAPVLNSVSQYVQFARATGGKLPPANTVAPVYLTGGGEGVTTINEWAAALKLLEKRRYNIIVPLTEDPAVHNLVLTHLIAKNGRLKSEAFGIVGIGTALGRGETRTNIQAQIQALNSRHVCAVSQEINKFSPAEGVATWYPPFMLAAMAAGMKAGAQIAEPLTRKTILVSDIRQDASWTIEDDASALIDRGLMMLEKVDGVGVRWIRSITTHLADDNLVFTEMSSNESLITFVYRFRTALELKIGQRGLGKSAGSIKSLALGVADAMVAEEIIVAFRSLTVDQIGDVFPVSIEIATVNPINFIPITVHLAPLTTSSAA